MRWATPAKGLVNWSANGRLRTSGRSSAQLRCNTSSLSFRDVEELRAERGIDVPHETIRRWVAVFGPMIARRLRAMRPKPHTTWHLDEMFVSIGGKDVS